MTTSNASIGGALKTVIEQVGLGLSAYRDTPPPRTRLPYAVITERIGSVILPHGDTDDPNRDDAVRQEAQIDVWQARRDPATGATTEQFDLADRLAFALHGTRLPTAPMLVHGVRVQQVTRIADPAKNLVHDVLTVAIDRRL